MYRKVLACITLLCSCMAVVAKDDYQLGPDSMEQPGVPKGEIQKFVWKSEIFEGTVRDWAIYVPKQYDPKTPTCVMVFQDGVSYMDPKGAYRVPTVFDNLIHKKEMPVTVAIFINPGTFMPNVEQKDAKVDGKKAGKKNPSNRSFEYDTLSDQYARFLDKEILPEAGKKLNLRTDAAGRAIAGASSGGICAFT